MNVIQVMLHKVTLGMTIAEDVYRDSQLLVQKGTIVNDGSFFCMFITDSVFKLFLLSGS